MKRSGWASVCVALALVALGAAAASTQTDGMPADVEQTLREIGRVIDPPKTFALYRPLHEAEPYAGVQITRDIAYGSAERQVLDVFTSVPGGGAPRPVLMFVHGGAFVGGTKKGPPGSFYFDNIGVWAVRSGWVGVTITYRLAPKFRWPSGAEDVASALRWIERGITRYGGDPDRVVLAGHSAGAVHVADYLAQPRLHVDAGGPRVTGAVLISGLYDVARFPAGAGNKAYYGEDSSKYAERSSEPGLLRSPVPLLVVYAELDPVSFETESKALAADLCKVGKCPRLVRLARHSHMSEVFAINTADRELTSEMAAFVNARR